MNDKAVYYPYFDYLRILLVTIVMLGHDKLISWPHSGKLAVDVFFSLSGWLIGGILLRTSSDNLPKFYFNRVARIWAPYYVAFSLIIIASIVKESLSGKWLEFVFYKLTFVYNLFGPQQLDEFRSLMPLNGTGNHFWSVNAEEQFYLLAPLLLVLIPKIGRSLITWIMISLLAWYFDIYAPISFGVLAAVMASKYGDFYSANQAKITLLIVATATAFGLAIDNHYTLYSPIFSISIVMLLAIKGKKHSLGAFLGGISYPLYLNHWIGVFFFNALLDPFGLRDSGIRQFLAALMNYGVAAVLYWYVDHRILPLRSRFFTKKRGMIAMVSAYGMVIIGLAVGIILTN